MLLLLIFTICFYTALASLDLTQDEKNILIQYLKDLCVDGGAITGKICKAKFVWDDYVAREARSFFVACEGHYNMADHSKLNKTKYAYFDSTYKHTDFNPIIENVFIKTIGHNEKAWDGTYCMVEDLFGVTKTHKVGAVYQTHIAEHDMWHRLVVVVDWEGITAP